jgi:flavin reductase (DIM6/NTAB) family NADH-FMN oxidoreductase RutF
MRKYAKNDFPVSEFEPSLIGCMITAANYSYDLIAKSKECVINLPTVDMIETVVGIGNTTGAEIQQPGGPMNA